MAGHDDEGLWRCTLLLPYSRPTSTYYHISIVAIFISNPLFLFHHHQQVSIMAMHSSNACLCLRPARERERALPFHFHVHVRRRSTCCHGRPGRRLVPRAYDSFRTSYCLVQFNRWLTSIASIRSPLCSHAQISTSPPQCDATQLECVILKTKTDPIG